MKRLLLLSILFLAAGAANASEFIALRDAARQLSATQEGQQYDRTVAPIIGDALRKCAPPTATRTSAPSKFTLVGVVSSAGKLSAVDVAPSTPVTQCFATQLGRMRFPPPPPASGVPNVAGYPIAVQMTLNR